MFINQRGHRLDLDNDFFIADEIRRERLDEVYARDTAEFAVVSKRSGIPWSSNSIARHSW